MIGDVTIVIRAAALVLKDCRALYLNWLGAACLRAIAAYGKDGAESHLDGQRPGFRRPRPKRLIAECLGLGGPRAYARERTVIGSMSPHRLRPHFLSSEAPALLNSRDVWHDGTKARPHDPAATAMARVTGDMCVST